MSIRVLLVEDDHDFRTGLENFLSAAGLSVRAIADARQLAQELEAHPPHIVVLDLNLPGPDGFSAAFALREKNAIGIIVLTGRTAREDRFHGLSLGVDHYLTKPTDPVELELMIRNLHRRLQAPAEPERLRAAVGEEWVLNSARWVLRCPTGVEIKLSNTEHRLLARLVARQGKPVPRADLLQENDSGDPASSARGLDVLVFRLRRKVEEECGCKLPVLAVRGVGYIFAEKIKRLPE